MEHENLKRELFAQMNHKTVLKQEEKLQNAKYDASVIRKLQVLERMQALDRACGMAKQGEVAIINLDLSNNKKADKNRTNINY